MILTLVLGLSSKKEPAKPAPVYEGTLYVIVT